MWEQETNETPDGFSLGKQGFAQDTQGNKGVTFAGVCFPSLFPPVADLFRRSGAFIHHPPGAKEQRFSGQPGGSGDYWSDRNCQQLAASSPLTWLLLIFVPKQSLDQAPMLQSCLVGLIKPNRLSQVVINGAHYFVGILNVDATSPESGEGGGRDSRPVEIQREILGDPA